MVSKTGGVGASESGEVFDEEEAAQKNFLPSISTLIAKLNNFEKIAVKGGVFDGLHHVRELKCGVYCLLQKWTRRGDRPDKC